MFMSGVTQIFASDLTLVGDYIGGEVGFIAPGDDACFEYQVPSEISPEIPICVGTFQ